MIQIITIFIENMLLKFLVVLSFFLGAFLLFFIQRTKNAGKRIFIIVLGDIGRSPRMCYHSLSFSRRDYEVDIIGYGGSQPHEDLLLSRNIVLHFMKEPPNFFKYIPKIMVYVLKVIWQTAVLLLILFSLKKPRYVFVQNPPSIPTLPVAWFFCWVCGCQLVIDWHNYGYTILALTLRKEHILVKMCKWVERRFGRLASKHLCVTKSMKEDLQDTWNIKASVLYDRPPEKFRLMTIEEMHFLFLKLGQTHPQLLSCKSDVNGSRCLISEEDETRFTIKSNGNISLKDDRPSLIVSSTSWTEDEDFSILLEALEEYEIAANNQADLPKILCAVTGKGPMKNYYQNYINNKQFRHIEVITPWLSAEDYPKFLGCADLGVCLHTSSSGLDLPMKVVDMFGCQLPVCAINYKSLDELVKHEENGLVFEGSKQLSKQFQSLLRGFPTEQIQLKQFSKNLELFSELRWDQCWEFSALHLFQDH